uniref:Uncharacterized protein n=1 Tax=Oreochromis aureus TaxID=47969 RepID=A0AAZ1XE24_OREAU
MEARVTSKWLKISLTLASVHVSIIRRILNNNGLYFVTTKRKRLLPYEKNPEDIWNNANTTTHSASWNYSCTFIPPS